VGLGVWVAGTLGWRIGMTLGFFLWWDGGWGLLSAGDVDLKPSPAEDMVSLYRHLCSWRVSYFPSRAKIIKSVLRLRLAYYESCKYAGRSGGTTFGPKVDVWRCVGSLWG